MYIFVPWGGFGNRLSTLCSQVRLYGQETDLTLQDQIVVIMERARPRARTRERGRFGVQFGQGNATKQKSLKRDTISLNEGKVFRE